MPVLGVFRSDKGHGYIGRADFGGAAKMFDRPKYIAMLAGATGGAIVHREHGGVFASDDLPHQPSQSNQALASLLKEKSSVR